MVIVSHERCLNHDQAHASCSACAKACPADAIALGNVAEVDGDCCTGCMACIEACPVAAISSPDFDALAIIEAAHKSLRSGQSHLRVSCAEAGGQAQASDMQVSCHACWSAPLLMELAALGLREISMQGCDKCSGCARRFGAQVLQSTLQELHILERSLSVRITVNTDPDTPDAASEADALPPRRAFFRNLVPELTRSAARVVAEVSRHAAGAASDEEKTSIVKDQPLARFLALLPAMRPNFTPVPPMRGLPVGALQGSKRCAGHASCVAQCPTQALALRPFGARAVLEFSAGQCLGCARCVQACPEQALELLPSISLPSLLSRPPRPLAMPARIAKLST
ncbi:MAG: 4Fe-4S dicluster domain-containing protein [Zetaproteobacteria bacterium]|nr:MAG: 4Fe-4S dicluster domain-containing protein [Zetaproteobacteria bacterium]